MEMKIYSEPSGVTLGQSEDFDTSCPISTAICGGNQETKIAEMGHGVVYTIDEQNQTVSDNGVVGCLTTDGSSPKHNNRVAYNYRIRKLTERECFRLMGVKDEDYNKIKPNQSKSSLYHLAGDSIVTTCLMAIFGALVEVDYQSKITELETALNNAQTANNK